AWHRARLAGALQHARRHRRARGRGRPRARGLRMTSDLDALYRDVILDHNKQPRNFRTLDGARKAEGHNPICGDRLTVYLRVERGVIEAATFQGHGCAIAKASASLMTDSVTGKTFAEAETLFERVYRLLTAPPGSPIE